MFETYPHIVMIPNAERELKIDYQIKSLAISGDESLLALTTDRNEIGIIDIGCLEILFDTQKLPSLEELIEQTLVKIKSIPNNLKHNKVELDVKELKFLTLTTSSRLGFIFEDQNSTQHL